MHGISEKGSTNRSTAWRRDQPGITMGPKYFLNLSINLATYLISLT